MNGDFDPKARMERASLQCRARVEKILSAQLGVRVYLPNKPSDNLRLLNLLAWSARYKLPVEDILSILVPIWRNKFSSRKPGSLGVSIATLTGQRSRQILEEYIRKEFPNKENIAKWKAMRQSEILSLPIYQGGYDPAQMAEEYIEHIKQNRTTAKNVGKKLSRRNFRDNPFV